MAPLENKAMPCNYAVEAGPMGAIGESASLMLRVNRHCPWNRCLFCPVYKTAKFSTRSVGDLKGDIDAICRTRELIGSYLQVPGERPQMSSELLSELVRRHSAIYGPVGGALTPEQRSARTCLANTAGWLSHGARRVFLQDADALAMKIPDLAETLEYLKRSFPTVDTVTCYARSKSADRRSVQELAALQSAGLSWCFMGVESGCDAVLGYMNKGVTGDEHIDAGRKLREAGIQVAAFVMPGLGGGDQYLSKKHIADTIAVLNRIEPQEVRLRSLAVLQSAPLYQRWQSGEFSAPSEDQLVDEIISLLKGIDFECTIETLQMTNPVVSIKGPLSLKRKPALDALAVYQALSPNERARFTLDRYLGGGYLQFVDDWGGIDQELEALIEQAAKSIRSGAGDALEKANRAVFFLKSKGIP
jgi:histone acetyltransferase (RNA polymerase elongator complex component)